MLCYDEARLARMTLQHAVVVGPGTAGAAAAVVRSSGHVRIDEMVR
jgi:hypothetical protein